MLDLKLLKNFVIVFLTFFALVAVVTVVTPFLESHNQQLQPKAAPRLLIVNQDGDTVINLDGVESAEVTLNGGRLLCRSAHNGKSYLLGSYQSRARAYEVLNELTTAWANDEKVFHVPQDGPPKFRQGKPDPNGEGE